MYRTMYSSSFNKFYPIIVQCEDICDRYCIKKKTLLSTTMLAQSVERVTAEREVAGSIPRAGPHAGC